MLALCKLSSGKLKKVPTPRRCRARGRLLFRFWHNVPQCGALDNHVIIENLCIADLAAFQDSSVSYANYPQRVCPWREICFF